MPCHRAICMAPRRTPGLVRPYPRHCLTVGSTARTGELYAELHRNRGRADPGADRPRGIRHEPHAEMAQLIRIAPCTTLGRPLVPVPRLIPQRAALPCALV